MQIVIKPKLKHSPDPKLCGKKTGAIIDHEATETERYAELTFHTDNKNTDKGFLITYSMLQSGKYYKLQSLVFTRIFLYNNIDRG